MEPSSNIPAVNDQSRVRIEINPNQFDIDLEHNQATKIITTDGGKQYKITIKLPTNCNQEEAQNLVADYKDEVVKKMVKLAENMGLGKEKSMGRDQDGSSLGKKNVNAIEFSLDKEFNVNQATKIFASGNASNQDVTKIMKKERLSFYHNSNLKSNKGKEEASPPILQPRKRKSGAAGVNKPSVSESATITAKNDSPSVAKEKALKMAGAFEEIINNESKLSDKEKALLRDLQLALIAYGNAPEGLKHGEIINMRIDENGSSVEDEKAGKTIVGSLEGALYLSTEGPEDPYAALLKSEKLELEVRTALNALFDGLAYFAP